MQYNIIDYSQHAVHYSPIRYKLALISSPSPQFRTELSVLSLYSSTMTVDRERDQAEGPQDLIIQKNALPT